MAALTQQQDPAGSPTDAAGPPDRFRSLCAALDEYEHLPELAAGIGGDSATGDQRSQADALAESILAGLTQP